MSDTRPPQIVVYALADAEAALSAAAAQAIAVTLVSPAGAAAFAGPAWFRALIAAAGDAVPAATFDAVLDCGSDAGDALAAIREGVSAICFDGPADVRAKIADIADQADCALVAIDYPGALDLDRHPAKATACRAWLAAKAAQKAV